MTTYKPTKHYRELSDGHQVWVERNGQGIYTLAYRSPEDRADGEEPWELAGLPRAVVMVMRSMIACDRVRDNYEVERGRRDREKAARKQRQNT